MKYPIINVAGVSKLFGRITILSDISLTVYPGEIVGLIGPNGGGKSTLMSILSGCVLPTSGSGFVCTEELFSGKCPFCGLMLESPPFVNNFSGFKNLMELVLLRNQADSYQVKRTLIRVGLNPKSNQPVRYYSQGMRQRLALAQAIMEKPPLLLLDEPLNGLDPTGIMDIRHLLIDIAGNGATVLFSSHVLSEVTEICDRVFLLHEGQIVELPRDEHATPKVLEEYYSSRTGYSYA